MVTPVVFKVKYGETLRRFRVSLDENGDLSLDMAGLKAKILGLFGFADDADVGLTYHDEDGDVVALVTDEDLNDTMTQNLDYVWVNVKLKNQKSAKSHAKSSRNSSTVQSLMPLNVLTSTDASVAELLKVVPEPLLEAVTQLSSDLASKTAGKAVADFVDGISKIGLNLAQQYQGGVGSSSQTGASDILVAPSTPQAPRDPLSHKDEGTKQVLPKPDLPAKINNEVNAGPVSSWPRVHASAFSSPDLIAKPNGGVASSRIGIPIPHTASNPDSAAKTNHEAASSSLGMPIPVPAVNLNQFSPQDPNPFAYAPPTGLGASSVSANNDGKGIKYHVPVHHCSIDGSGLPSGFFYPPSAELVASSSFSVPMPVAASNPNLAAKTNEEVKAGAASSGPRVPIPVPTVDLNQLHNSSPSANAAVASGASSESATIEENTGKNLFHDRPCAAAGSGWPTGFFYPPGPMGGVTYPSMRYYCPPMGIDAPGNFFHKGVQCGGCGVLPITGPRYKSKVKEDYDLCRICFAEMGNDADFIKIDNPASSWFPRHGGTRVSWPRLDSRFICDVNVPDGSIMAPSTPFTKIWKMKNSGNVTWHQGTKLVWVGGDKFNHVYFADLKISANGVATNEEIDIAVDFVSPGLPGRYISYWRLVSPSGERFGQRVWVLIQVISGVKDAASSNGPRRLNLNMLPDADFFKTFGSTNVNAGNVEPSMGTLVTGSAEAKSDEHPQKNKELNLSTNDSGTSNHTTPQSLSASCPVFGSSAVCPAHIPGRIYPRSPFSYPIIDTSEMEPVVQSSQETPAVTAPTSTEEVSLDHPVEGKLLKQLEGMGFEQVDLNKEILRKNQYDLDRSLDDLTSGGDWYPMLQELEEMGFCDEERNRWLLKKNNGSIEHVVMDLIAAEKKA